MKKILKILTCAAILISGLALTGCGAKEIIKESVNDSFNTWYKYKTSRQIDVPLLDASVTEEDTTEESATKLKNAEIYVLFNPNTGLKVAVQSVTHQQVSLLGGLYEQNMDVVVGDTHDYPLEKFGKKSWYALWGSGKFEKTSAPKIVTNPEQCVIIGDATKAPNKKIQWKKFLANYLLNSLLED